AMGYLYQSTTKQGSNKLLLLCCSVSPNLSILLVLYIAYIRPFGNMIYSQTSTYKQGEDANYLFCLDESPQKCWNGKILSKTLQKESKAWLGVKINMRMYRQLAIAIAKTHLKEIAAYFDKNDELCECVITQNNDYLIFRG